MWAGRNANVTDRRSRMPAVMQPHPAPPGPDWSFQNPVGVDCSAPEPRCIWVAVLRRAASPPFPSMPLVADGDGPGQAGMVGLPPQRPMGNGRRDGLPSASDSARPAVATCTGRDGGGVGGGGGGGGGGMAWHGPRTLLLRKTAQGFGFTLRHFIVYPPESALQTSLKDEENGNGKGYQRSPLEPMDTIFVKNVRERGPAHQAGLCAGDRLVKVNGESILGKTYSQVIALIQNSESVLELSIMPKDQDVLQLAYSQDAYLRGNEPYSGEAKNLPPPPPTCYPRRSQALSGGPLSPSSGPMGQNQLDNWGRWTGSSGPSSPLDNRSAAVSPAAAAWRDGRAGELGGVGHSSPAHRTEEIQYGMTAAPPPAPYRGRSFSSSSSSGGLLAGPLQVHYHASAQAPSPWRSQQTWVSPPQPKLAPPPPQQQQQQQHPGSRSRAQGERCQQALSDWYHSQQVPERSGRRMQTRHRSYSQDRLGETRSRRQQQQQRTGAWPHSASQDTLMLPQQPDPGPHRPDPYWAYEDWEAEPGRAQRASNYARTRSEDLLAQYDRSRGRSLEMLERTGPVLVSPRLERPAPPWSQQPPAPPQRTEAPQRAAGQYPSAQGPPGQRHAQPHHKPHPQAQAYSQNQTYQSQAYPQAQPAAPQSRRLATAQSADDQPVGYRSYSPSFYRKTGRILQQAHSFRDPSYSGPHLNWSPTPKTSPPEGAPAPSAAAAAASSSPPTGATTPDLQARRYRPTNHERDRASGSGSGSGSEEKQAEVAAPAAPEVVLRQKPPTGRRNAYGMRHPHYALPLDGLDPGLFSPEGDDSAFITPPPQPSARGDGGPRRANGAPAPLSIEEDSLASIPFIDEPTSPSVDLCARHVPASAVVSGALSSAPAAVTSPASPTFTFPHDRLFSSHDCSSIKSSRRSSYLLAITTERSKSCDEGLNSFREEGRVFSRLPKRVKSFFTDGSLDQLGTAEEVRSKRHSTSELGTITYSDVRKEGWLHYKQILTEKGKKVGGGMRPWRRVFSVLRSHSLFLYKDKREAVLRGATVGGGAEDEQPISIRGCLVDIAYSETKRKHALRLATQDFCEYLLQAEDREDMLAWIKVIRETGKTDEEFGFSRQALISKKLNDYRKQSPTGSKPDSSPKAARMKPPFLSKMESAAGAPRSPKTEGKEESSPPKSPWGINIIKKAKKGTGPKAFGVRLEDCQPGANNKFIPLIVEICCGLVEEMGLEYTGIYRVPGNNAMVSTLQDQLNKGLDINPTEEKWQDLNVVSSLLKSFFRKLPEPVFTDDKYNDFIDANRLDSSSERLKTMNKLIRDLPDHYYHTLKFLIGHLKTVADHSDKNKMEPRNLALVFGPTLVRTSEDNMTDMVTHMPDRYKIVETLIQHYIWFFTDEMDMDEKTPVETVDVQPAPNIDHLLSNIGRTPHLGEASESTNSDGAKAKMPWGSKGDFLSLSIMSAVTGRKRRKRHGRRGARSIDDSSGQEPIRPSQAESEEGEEAESPPGDTAPRALGEEDDDEEEEEEEEAGQEAFQTIVHVTEESGEESLAATPDQTPATPASGELPPPALPREEEEEEESEKERAGPKGSPWRSPEDARSIVSGYSTLSTLGRSLRSHGDDADDEHSELVSETDNESGFASRSLTQERPEKHPVPPVEAPPAAGSPPAMGPSRSSFLYTHCKAAPSPAPAPGAMTPLAQRTPEPAERSGGSRAAGGHSTPSSSSSSSAAAHRLHARPSFNSHRLIQCDTLARKKAKARSMDLLDSLGPDRGEAGLQAGRDPPRTDPSSGSSQESLRAAPHRLAPPPAEASSFSPSGGQASGRGSLVDQVRARLMGSADDLRSVGLRKPLSPETRRKRRAWRRHTVVASPTETSGKRPPLLSEDLPLSPLASPLQRLDAEPGAVEEPPTSRRAPPSRFSQYL